jgi:hypothetical protein
MNETKAVRLSLISAYGQERMAEIKPVLLSLISPYGQGRMAENKHMISINFYMYKEEWLSPNPYDYP